MVDFSLASTAQNIDTALSTVLNSNLSATHKITRSATIVIAASDSSEKSKAQADYVCTGANDHITINAAIATLPATGNVTIPGSAEALEANQGGKVLLLEGSFQTAGAIDVSGRSNVTIEGVGPATVIYNTATDGSNAIQAINTTAKNRIVIKNLTVMGNALSGDGIHLEAVNYQKIEDVYCLSNGGCGIHICGTFEAQGAENKIVSNVQCLFNKLDGLRLESLGTGIAIHETLIANSHFEENYRYNVALIRVIDPHLSNCSIEDCHGTYGLFTSARPNDPLKISNCIIEDTICLSGEVTQISNSHVLNITTSVPSVLYLSNHRGAITDATFKYLYVSNASPGTGKYAGITATHCDISGFEGTIENSTFTNLRITNSYAILSGNTVTEGNISGSEIVMRGTHTLGDVTIGSSYVNFDQLSSITNVSNTLSMCGCNLSTYLNAQLNFSGDKSRITLTGNNMTMFRPAIGLNGTLTSTRLLINANNFRTSTFTISGVSILHIESNAFVGTGSLTVSNMTGIINISNNIISNNPITVDDTCSPSAKQFVNNLGGTVTDNSV
jgi:hypothetical protein